MISDIHLSDLPDRHSQLYDFGLTEKEVGRIHETGCIEGSTILSMLGGLGISWGLWLYCVFGWWEWQKFDWFLAIFGALFLGVMPCMFSTFYVVGLAIKKIERYLIGSEKIRSYEILNRVRDDVIKGYLEAFNKMGISIENRYFIARDDNSKKISKAWSELFYDPDIETAHFKSLQLLPLEKHAMENFFRHEIFIEQWVDENTKYLESLKTNFIINLPSFIDIESKVLNPPLVDLKRAIDDAKNRGVPIDAEASQDKLIESATSKEQAEFVKLMKKEEEEMDQNSRWVSTFEFLMAKLKMYDESFFWYQSD